MLGLKPGLTPAHTKRLCHALNACALKSNNNLQLTKGERHVTLSHQSMWGYCKTLYGAMKYSSNALSISADIAPLAIFFPTLFFDQEYTDLSYPAITSYRVNNEVRKRGVLPDFVALFPCVACRHNQRTGLDLLVLKSCFLFPQSDTTTILVKSESTTMGIYAR